MIGACIKQENIDSAMKIFSDIISENPDIVINQILILRLAALLVTNSRSEDAMTVLKHLKPSQEKNPAKNTLIAVEKRVFQLLDVAVNSKNIDLTLQLFNVLKDSEAFKMSQNILLRVVKCHAIRFVLHPSFELKDYLI